QAIELTMTFIDRELSNGEGAFYSALDADSEGIEGKYYVWEKAGIDRLLGEDAALFNAYNGVTEAGNWEGATILRRTTDLPADGDTAARLESARLKLLEYRSQRI